MEDIFASHLPWVGEDRRRAFCQGMVAYHEQFRLFRDESMNFEHECSYQDDVFHLMHMESATDCWIYTPQCQRMIMVMLGALFGTDIKSVGIVSPLRSDQLFAFMDGNKNRWCMMVDARQIRMRFPRKVAIAVKAISPIVSEEEIYSVGYDKELLVDLV